ncbi:MAG: hypothetical protein RIR86_357, partial [Acidobacteriota bacterium]
RKSGKEQSSRVINQVFRIRLIYTPF